MDLAALCHHQMGLNLTRGWGIKKKPSKTDPVAFFLHVLDGGLLEAVWVNVHVLQFAWKQSNVNNERTKYLNALKKLTFSNRCLIQSGKELLETWSMSLSDMSAYSLDCGGILTTSIDSESTNVHKKLSNDNPHLRIIRTHVGCR